MPVTLSLPTVTNILANKAELGCDASEEGGTAYWAISNTRFKSVADGDTQEEADADKLRIINAVAGEDGIIACGNMPNTFTNAATATGLTPSTEAYYVGWVQKHRP